MKMYDVHSHLGKTSSGEENSAALLVEDLARYGITKVGISSLSGTVTRVQNDLVHSAMQQFPGVVMGYAFINPKAPDVFDEIDRCLGDYKMNGVKFHPWKHGYYADNCPQIDEVSQLLSTTASIFRFMWERLPYARLGRGSTMLKSIRACEYSLPIWDAGNLDTARSRLCRIFRISGWRPRARRNTKTCRRPPGSWGQNASCLGQTGRTNRPILKLKS